MVSVRNEKNCPSVIIKYSSYLEVRGLFHEHILDLCLSYNLSHDLSKKVRMT